MTHKHKHEKIRIDEEPFPKDGSSVRFFGPFRSVLSRACLA